MLVNPEAQKIEAEYDAKIAAAQRATAERLDAVWVDAPFDVCGFPIRRMTLRDYVALIVANNAHVVQLEAPVDDVRRGRFWRDHNAQLMWFLSPDFAPRGEGLEGYLKSVGKLDPIRVDAEVREFIFEMFADAPRAPVLEGDAAPAADPVGVSFVAHWVGRVARRFPWSRAEILALPLPELWQYLRLIRAEKLRENGEAIVARDDAVDRLWAEKLEKLTALAQEKKI